MKLASLTALLAALVLASSASAGPNYAGVHISYKATAGPHFVVYHVYLTSDTKDVKGGPTTMLLTASCSKGHYVSLRGQPFSASIRSGMVGAFGSKSPYLMGMMVDDLAPLHSRHSAELKIVFATPKHAAPFSVCIRAEATQRLPDKRTLKLGRDMAITLKKANV